MQIEIMAKACHISGKMPESHRIYFGKIFS
jgi:hypothetical protein